MANINDNKKLHLLVSTSREVLNFAGSTLSMVRIHLIHDMGFKTALLNEFIPSDHSRRARGKLKGIKENASVEIYMDDFRNIMLMIGVMIGDMSEGERIDCFIDGLKYNVRVKVMKKNYVSFED